jgi:hypothetical protein
LTLEQVEAAGFRGVESDMRSAAQDPSSVRRLLDQHLRRLEDGLADILMAVRH